MRAVCVLALDRFADYVSDQVLHTSCTWQHRGIACAWAAPAHVNTHSTIAAQAVAPVRETAAQALGAAVQPLGIESLRVLLSQLQTLACSVQWEVRHSGLLALKYVIAARPDSAAQLLPLAVDIATAGLKVQDVA